MSVERSLRPAGATEDVPVTWADQQNINAFGRLHTRMMDIDEELIAKKAEYENVKDAAADIEDQFDDDCCKIKIGEIFFEVSNDEAVQFAQRVSDEKQKEYDTLVKEKNDIQTEMERLKTILYNKFGNTINLDTK